MSQYFTSLNAIRTRAALVVKLKLLTIHNQLSSLCSQNSVTCRGVVPAWHLTITSSQRFTSWSSLRTLAAQVVSLLLIATCKVSAARAWYKPIEATVSEIALSSPLPVGNNYR